MFSAFDCSTGICFPCNRAKNQSLLRQRKANLKVKKVKSADYNLNEVKSPERCSRTRASTVKSRRISLGTKAEKTSLSLPEKNSNNKDVLTVTLVASTNPRSSQNTVDVKIASNNKQIADFDNPEIDGMLHDLTKKVMQIQKNIQVQNGVLVNASQNEIVESLELISTSDPNVIELYKRSPTQKIEEKTSKKKRKMVSTLLKIKPKREVIRNESYVVMNSFSDVSNYESKLETKKRKKLTWDSECSSTNVSNSYLDLPECSSTNCGDRLISNVDQLNDSADVLKTDSSSSVVEKQKCNCSPCGKSKDNLSNQDIAAINGSTISLSKKINSNIKLANGNHSQLDANRKKSTVNEKTISSHSTIEFVVVNSMTVDETNAVLPKCPLPYLDCSEIKHEIKESAIRNSQKESRTKLSDSTNKRLSTRHNDSNKIPITGNQTFVSDDNAFLRFEKPENNFQIQQERSIEDDSMQSYHSLDSVNVALSRDRTNNSYSIYEDPNYGDMQQNYNSSLGDLASSNRNTLSYFTNVNNNNMLVYTSRTDIPDSEKNKSFKVEEDNKILDLERKREYLEKVLKCKCNRKGDSERQAEHLDVDVNCDCSSKSDERQKKIQFLERYLGCDCHGASENSNADGRSCKCGKEKTDAAVLQVRLSTGNPFMDNGLSNGSTLEHSSENRVANEIEQEIPSECRNGTTFLGHNVNSSVDSKKSYFSAKSYFDRTVTEKNVKVFQTGLKTDTPFDCTSKSNLIQLPVLSNGLTLKRVPMYKAKENGHTGMPLASNQEGCTKNELHKKKLESMFTKFDSKQSLSEVPANLYTSKNCSKESLVICGCGELKARSCTCGIQTDEVTPGNNVVVGYTQLPSSSSLGRSNFKTDIIKKEENNIHGNNTQEESKLGSFSGVQFATVDLYFESKDAALINVEIKSSSESASLHLSLSEHQSNENLEFLQSSIYSGTKKEVESEIKSVKIVEKVNDQPILIDSNTFSNESETRTISPSKVLDQSSLIDNNNLSNENETPTITSHKELDQSSLIDMNNLSHESETQSITSQEVLPDTFATLSNTEPLCVFEQQNGESFEFHRSSIYCGIDKKLEINILDSDMKRIEIRKDTSIISSESILETEIRNVSYDPVLKGVKSNAAVPVSVINILLKNMSEKSEVNSNMFFINCDKESHSVELNSRPKCTDSVSTKSDLKNKVSNNSLLTIEVKTSKSDEETCNLEAKTCNLETKTCNLEAKTCNLEAKTSNSDVALPLLEQSLKSIKTFSNERTVITKYGTGVNTQEPKKGQDLILGQDFGQDNCVNRKQESRECTTEPNISKTKSRPKRSELNTLYTDVKCKNSNHTILSTEQIQDKLNNSLNTVYILDSLIQCKSNHSLNCGLGVSLTKEWSSEESIDCEFILDSQLIPCKSIESMNFVYRANSPSVSNRSINYTTCADCGLLVDPIPPQELTYSDSNLKIEIGASANCWSTIFDKKTEQVDQTIQEPITKKISKESAPIVNTHSNWFSRKRLRSSFDKAILRVRKRAFWKKKDLVMT